MIFLFDIDGVINKAPYFSVSYKKDFGIDESVISEFFNEEFNLCCKGKVAIEKIIRPYFKKWKWEKTVDEFLLYWFQHNSQLDEELLAVVHRLRKLGYKVGLASQQEKRRMEYLWKTDKLKEHFDYFFCSCEIGYLKDEPFFYEKIKQNFPKNAPIYFWDDRKKNVETAKAAGINSFFFENNQNLKLELEEILAV